MRWKFWQKTSPSKPYEIGGQLAQARLAEQAPSPLPANLHYDKWLGDFNLSDPAKHPLDDELGALCRRFAASDPAGRSKIRDSASLDDFYTLLLFSQRSAVFGMRDRSIEHVVDGLTAIALIEKSRIDFGDPLIALSLLNHAGRLLNADIDDLLARAAALAEPGMSELILGFLRRSEDQRALQKSWGYSVIETKSGPGIVEWWFKPYQPSFPLDQIALALAQLLKRDKYLPVMVSLASALPPVWLSSVDDKALESALSTVRATVSMYAQLRPDESPDHGHQHLILFLVELEHESAAQTLFRLAQEKQTQPKAAALVAVNEGRLFCLAVARSFMAGNASFETHESMQRFSAGISAVLRDQTQN